MTLVVQGTIPLIFHTFCVVFLYFICFPPWIQGAWVLLSLMGCGWSNFPSDLSLRFLVAPTCAPYGALGCHVRSQTPLKRLHREMTWRGHAERERTCDYMELGEAALPSFQMGPAFQPSYQGTTHMKEAILDVPPSATIWLQLHDGIPSKTSKKKTLQMNPRKLTKS